MPEDVPFLPDAQLLSEGDIPFENAEEEALFQQTLPPFRDPAAQTGGGRILLISIALFVLAEVLSGQRDFDIHWLAILVGSIFLHEMGHYFGMVLFGYRDVRMFFIPFFGAAVAGRKHAAPPWQQLIVLLLGPLPGIALAWVLYALSRPAPDKHLSQAIFVLIMLNGFNLLPLYPMDGGRIASLVLFSRHAVLEALFQLVAVVAFVALGFFEGSWILFLLAGLVLVTIPINYRLRRMAADLRADHPELPGELEDLSLAEERELFWRVRTAFAANQDPKMVANHMRSLHEMAVTRPPGILTSSAFVVLSVASFLAAARLIFWMLP